MLRQIVIALFATTSCVHEHVVHDLTPPRDHRDAAMEELAEECDEESCRIRDCWSETVTLVMCDVEFSSTSQSEQRRILLDVGYALEKRGHRVGFCAWDSPGERAVEEIAHVMVFGVPSFSRYGHEHEICVDPIERVDRR